MKKIFYLLLIATLLVGCNKDSCGLKDGTYYGYKAELYENGQLVNTSTYEPEPWTANNLLIKDGWIANYSYGNADEDLIIYDCDNKTFKWVGNEEWNFKITGKKEFTGEIVNEDKGQITKWYWKYSTELD
jgi:hypothetical protein